MFAGRYFAPRYFPPRYFSGTDIGTALVGSATVGVTGSAVLTALPKATFGTYCNPKADPAITTVAAYNGDNPGHVAAYTRGNEYSNDHQYYILKWSDLEPTIGNYNFTFLDRFVDNTGSLPLIFNLAVVDAGGAKHWPSDLSTALAFTNSAVTDAFNDLLSALVSHFDGRLQQLTIGNEINDWLDDNPGTRVPEYASFLDTVGAHARSVFPDLHVSTCFAFPAIADWVANSYATIQAEVDFVSITYYPIDYTDFTVKDIGTEVGPDWVAIQNAVNGPWGLQEVGAPSSATLGASEAYQETFVQVLTTILIPAYLGPTALQHANWVWMHDLSDDILDDLGLTGNQRAFIGSLGLRTVNDAAKAGWDDWIGFLGAFEGMASASITGSASLTTQTVLVGAATLTVAPVAALTTQIALVGSASLTITAAIAPLPSTGVSFKLEMEFDGFLNGWTDVTADLLRRVPLTGSRGLPDGTPRALVAQTGVMMFALDNSEANSAGLIRYYSPGDANCRTGFAKGIGVRFSIIVNGEQIPQFTGRLEDIKPTPGVRLSRMTECKVVDFMDEMAKRRLSTLSLQTDISETDAFGMLVATMPLQPRALQIGTAVDTLDYVFDTVQDERTSPMREGQRLNQSTLARTYVKADGTLTYEPRSVRALDISGGLITLDPADFQGEGTPEIDDARSTAINRAIAQLHPRTISQEPDRILYENTAPFLVPPLIDIAVRGYYSQDTLRARRAGGLDMLPAEATTDYVFNTQPDGSGADVTADVTLNTVYTANSVIFTINSPVPAWVTKLQSRGTQIVDSADMSVYAEDAASIALNGEVAFSLDMPYVNNPTFGTEVVQYVLFLAQSNQKRVKNVRLEVTNRDDARAALIARREISDRVLLSEPMNVLSNVAFFINAVSFELDGEGRYFVEWLPSIADSTQYWYLEIPGYSELDFTTRLGFGLIVGHTDIDHDDFHTDEVHQDLAHQDTHGDTLHSDAAHADYSHGDTAHQDVAHQDVAHVDQHQDAEHGDIAHQDSHSDVAHSDAHYDQAHTDTAHGDIAFQGYTDEHTDIHGDHVDVAPPWAPPDYHNDFHNDAHIDDGGHPHTDSPHLDAPHGDQYWNSAHSDTHNDQVHTDGIHLDSHSDVAHQDVTHQDAHSDEGHGDAGHGDTAHSDSHADVNHDDVAHEDEHGDMAHGDRN